MAALLPLALLWAVGSSAGAVPRQDSSSTTIDTTDDLLEGNTTVPQTTVDPSSTTVPGDSGSGSKAGDETRTVWLIVLALVLVAIALALVTYRYWKRTAPARPQPFDQDRADEPVDAERPRVGR